MTLTKRQKHTIEAGVAVGGVVGLLYLLTRGVKGSLFNGLAMTYVIAKCESNHVGYLIDGVITGGTPNATATITLPTDPTFQPYVVMLDGNGSFTMVSAVPPGTTFTAKVVDNTTGNSAVGSITVPNRSCIGP